MSTSGNNKRAAVSVGAAGFAVIFAALSGAPTREGGFPTDLSSLPSESHLARTSSERAWWEACQRARSMGWTCDVTRMSA